MSPRAWSRRGGMEKNLLPLSRIEPPPSSPFAVTIPTELPQLPYYIHILIRGKGFRKYLYNIQLISNPRIRDFLD